MTHTNKPESLKELYARYNLASSKGTSGSMSTASDAVGRTGGRNPVNQTVTTSSGVVVTVVKRQRGSATSSRAKTGAPRTRKQTPAKGIEDDISDAMSDDMFSVSGMHETASQMPGTAADGSAAGWSDSGVEDEFPRRPVFYPYRRRKYPWRNFKDFRRDYVRWLTSPVRELVQWYSGLFLEESGEDAARELLEDAEPIIHVNVIRGIAASIGAEARLKFLPRAWTDANEIVITRWCHNQVRDHGDVRKADVEHVTRLAVLRAFTPNQDEVVLSAARNSQTRAARIAVHHNALLPNSNWLVVKAWRNLKRNLLPNRYLARETVVGPGA